MRAIVVVALFSLLAYSFCGIYFPLDTSKLGGPGDFDPYATIDWIVAKPMAELHQLPLWNRHVYTGMPLAGDAYVSFYNPAVVLPLMIFGSVNGAKVAVLLALAISGAGQYWLARVLGQNRVIALAGGVVGLSAGTLVARLASGFNLGQSLQHAWMAPTLAAFLLALRTQQPRWIAAAAVLYALLFHAGNLYLWIVLSFVLVLFVLGYAIDPYATPAGFRLRVRWRVLGAGAFAASLAALLDAVQGVPMLAFRALVSKPIDPYFRGTEPVLPTLFSFVVPDVSFWRNDLFGAIDLGWSIYYSYVGASVLVFLIVLVPLLWSRRSRDLLLLTGGIAISVAIASGRHTVVYELWKRWDLLRQLRYWSTATHTTTVLLIPLALAGAQYLWDWLDNHRGALDRLGPRLEWPALSPAHGHSGTAVRGDGGISEAGPGVWRVGVAYPLLLGALLLALWNAAVDPWRVNGRLWNTPPYNQAIDDAFAWLRQYDNGAYLVANNDNAFGSFATTAQVKYDMQVLNSVYPFKPTLRATPGAPDGGLFVATPKYIDGLRGGAAVPGARVLHEAGNVIIYQGPPGLPFSWVAAPERLPYGQSAGASALAEGTIAEAPARFDGPNRIVVDVPSSVPTQMTTLVVMQSWAPGWTARDAGGAAAGVHPAGGFLGIEHVRPGTRYELSFLPPSFVAGAVLSAIGVAGAAGLLALDLARWRRRNAA